MLIVGGQHLTQCAHKRLPAVELAHLAVRRPLQIALPFLRAASAPGFAFPQPQQEKVVALQMPVSAHDSLFPHTAPLSIECADAFPHDYCSHFPLVAVTKPPQKSVYTDLYSPRSQTRRNDRTFRRLAETEAQRAWHHPG